MTDDNKRHNKYIKRNQNKKKEYYKLRSLVHEITGISPKKSGDKDDNNNFDTAYKEVQRIVDIMQKTLGVKGKIKIHHLQKDGFVQMMRALYFESTGVVQTGQARHLYEKLRRNESMTEQEMIELTELYKDSWEANPDTPEKQAVLEQARIEEAFLAWMDDVKKGMLEDIELVDRLATTPRKLERMQEYLDLHKQGLENWRQQLYTDLFEEELIQKLADIAVEKGYDPIEVLSNEESPAYQDSYRELIARDSQVFIRLLGEHMKQLP